MTLKEKIAYDMKEAMKLKDTVKRDSLRVLMGELERAEQTKEGKVVLSDTDVETLIKKSCNNLKEIIGVVNSTTDISQEIKELEILQSYLPKQFTEEEIKAKVDELITESQASSMKDMGKVIGLFNSKYPNLADGKVVSIIVKNKLS